MAPIKKMTQNEQRLEQRPWITKGILKSMKIRDSLYKKIVKKDNPQREEILVKYKKYRNSIVTLQRKSKEMYFQNFFETNKNDVKKTWKGIKNILAVSKKKVTSIDYLSYKGKMCKNDNDKANALNDFFTNIGKMVVNKIPKSKKRFSLRSEY